MASIVNSSSGGVQAYISPEQLQIKATSSSHTGAALHLDTIHVSIRLHIHNVSNLFYLQPNYHFFCCVKTLILSLKCFLRNVILHCRIMLKALNISLNIKYLFKHMQMKSGKVKMESYWYSGFSNRFHMP